MNTLAIILLEVPVWKAILTIFGVAIAWIFISCISENYKERRRLKNQIEEEKNKETDQTNTKQKTDVKEHELPNIWIDN